mgnify:CR=1 FL=1
MNYKKSIIVAFVLMLAASIIYRVIPNRPDGFAPQFAIALLAGAMIRRKAWAFALPLLSMFLSDVFYEGLYKMGYNNTPGFYEDQWMYYVLFTSLTIFGFFIKNYKISRIFIGALAAPTAYFLLSNAIVWFTGWGYQRSTLLECYVDGLPFYKTSVLATLAFSAVFFGIMYGLTHSKQQPVVERAK